jgi:hypothetical protein
MWTESSVSSNVPDGSTDVKYEFSGETPQFCFHNIFMGIKRLEYSLTQLPIWYFNPLNS